jgi:DNA repair exonuclease SbcCD ATPase subunit
VYLKEIRLRHIKCFEDVTLRFPEPKEDGNWCVILGDNGTGKTTLLQAIALSLTGPGGLVNNPRSFISVGAERAECEATFVKASGELRPTSYDIRNIKPVLDDLARIPRLMRWATSFIQSRGFRTWRNSFDA